MVVATTALGMGFDHPALKFVIHFQSPQSVIHYYQQVGRAGRRLSDSYGILFKGIEDDEINKYFIENAFPSEEDTEMVMTFIESHGDLITKNDILKVLNISSMRLDKVLKHLEIQQGVERIEGRYRRTLNVWEYDASIEYEISEVRYAELAEMKEYLATEECRNTFLMKSLHKSIYYSTIV